MPRTQGSAVPKHQREQAKREKAERKQERRQRNRQAARADAAAIGALAPGLRRCTGLGCSTLHPGGGLCRACQRRSAEASGRR